MPRTILKTRRTGKNIVTHFRTCSLFIVNSFLVLPSVPRETGEAVRLLHATIAVYDPNATKIFESVEISIQSQVVLCGA